jgi:hypothetical protein
MHRERTAKASTVKATGLEVARSRALQLLWRLHDAGLGGAPHPPLRRTLARERHPNVIRTGLGTVEILHE